MMRDIFFFAEHPFYRFGDVVFLDRIEAKYLMKFITGAFKRTGKFVSEEHALKIAALMKTIPSMFSNSVTLCGQ